ncbi:MAG: MarR family winged helix-turn-helix transcriptional regulator [Rhizobiaceae bacterium]
MAANNGKGTALRHLVAEIYSRVWHVAARILASCIKVKKQRGRFKNKMRTAEAALSPYDYQTLAAFRFALRGFLSFSETAARAVGLTPRQHQALLGIKAASIDNMASVSHLAAFLTLHHNSTVELVNRLEAAGLVARKQDPADRRRVLLCLTTIGERCLADLSTVHLTELQRVRVELESLLDRTNAN